MRAIAAALALIGCSVLPGAARAQGPRAGEPARHSYTIAHVLRYATGEDIVGLNPHLNTQLVVSYMSSLAMAWLVRYDAHDRPVPELATAVPSRSNGGISADGKTITYHLRRDARWSDGVAFTADDVRFSVDVVRNPNNNELTHVGFDLIDRVDTPDPYTVVFRLKRPHAGFFVNFFGSAFAQPCILPKHLLAGQKTINEAPYNALPVGIGPFKYTSWKRADAVELVPDPLYFGRKPKLQRVIFKIVPNRDTVLTQLTTHEIDLWLPVPAAYYDRVRALPGVRVLRRAGFGYDHIDLELQHGALRELAVRRALRLATDRATILAKVRHGVGALAETVVPPAHAFHLDAPRIPYDIGAANALLDGAGWRRGADGIRVKHGERLSFAFAIGTGLPDTEAIVELLRASWAQIGVTFELRKYPSPLFFAPAQSGGIVYGGKFDAAIYAWFLGPNADLTNLFACDRFPPQGANVPRYCDPAVDRALARYDATYDEGDQRAALRVVQEHVLHDVPTIVLDAREDLFAANDDVHGFAPNHVTAFDDLVDADI